MCLLLRLQGARAWIAPIGFQQAALLLQGDLHGSLDLLSSHLPHMSSATSASFRHLLFGRSCILAAQQLQGHSSDHAGTNSREAQPGPRCMQKCIAHRHSNATGSIQLGSIVGLVATALQVCKCRIELLGGLQRMQSGMLPSVIDTEEEPQHRPSTHLLPDTLHDHYTAAFGRLQSLRWSRQAYLSNARLTASFSLTTYSCRNLCR